MLLKTSSGLETASPSAPQLEHALNQLADPADFIVLTDLVRGELRFAGPQGGTFLGQCDVPVQTHLYSGELTHVPAAEALMMLKAFLAGDTSWVMRFREVRRLSKGSLVIVLVTIIIGSTIAYFWLVARR